MKESLFNMQNELVEKLDLPKDVMLNLPKITVIGDEEILIENHKGIESFENEFIKIKTKCGVVEIAGKNFEILYIAAETIVISGKFKSINYEDATL